MASSSVAVSVQTTPEVDIEKEKNRSLAMIKEEGEKWNKTMEERLKSRETKMKQLDELLNQKTSIFSSINISMTEDEAKREAQEQAAREERR